MNALEHQLQYPFGETMPEPGARQQVAPGVYWLRMPLPFALDHINLWLVRDRVDGRDGWTVIDCGITNDTRYTTPAEHEATYYRQDHPALEPVTQ